MIDDIQKIVKKINIAPYIEVERKYNDINYKVPEYEKQLDDIAQGIKVFVEDKYLNLMY